MSRTYAVLWVYRESGIADVKFFNGDELKEALAFSKEKTDEGALFATLASEDTDRVGKRGVDVTDDSYSWTKRRSVEPPRGTGHNEIKAYEIKVWFQEGEMLYLKAPLETVSKNWPRYFDYGGYRYAFKQLGRTPEPTQTVGEYGDPQPLILNATAQ